MAKKKTTQSNAKRYEQQWDVPSESDPSAYYTVSLTQEQQLICNCWPFLRTRQPCKHIKRVQRGEIAPRGQPQVAPSMPAPAASTPVTSDEPTISLAKVRCVTPVLDASGVEVVKVKVPDIPKGNDHFMLTVLADLMSNGVSWATIQQRYSLPRDLTQKWVKHYVQEYGRLIYDTSFTGFEYIAPR
jgi:hypothetical protein